MPTTPAVPVRVFKTPAEGGRAAAVQVLDAAEVKDHFVLGLPSGRSPMPLLVALEELVEERQPDLSNVAVVQMDDYAEESVGGFRRVDASLPHSCELWGRVEVLERLNRHLPEAKRLNAKNIHLPDAGDPAAYESVIDGLGGVDLFVLASGQTDGHVAFNPPGSSRASTTRVITLAENTRRDNLSTFESFGGDLSRVPLYGISVGVGTIERVAKSSLLLAWGEDKAVALKRIRETEGYDPEWPSTIINVCRNASIIADVAAASQIEAGDVA